jgi:hypothetical protein
MDPALNITQFPSKKLSNPVWEEKSATEELLEKVKQQKISSDDENDDDNTHSNRAAQV